MSKLSHDSKLAKKYFLKEGFVNFIIFLFSKILGRLLGKFFNKYYVQRRFDIKYKELKPWRYSISSWIVEAEHQLGRLQNLEKIFKCLKQLNTKGHIVEFGSYRGLSLVWMARFRNMYKLNDSKIIGIDSFDGLPESSGGWEKGHFNDTSLDITQSNLTKNLSIDENKNIHIIQGLFTDKQVSNKLNNLLGEEKIILAHIDCDLGKSATEALELIKTKITNGCFICFDDWGCGEDEIPKAWNNFLTSNPNIKCVEFSSTNLTKYFFVYRTK